MYCDAPFIPQVRLRGIAINHKRVKQLTLRPHWVTLATPRRGEPAPGLELRFGLISRILSRRHAWEHSAARSALMPWLVHDASARTGARLSKRKFQRITMREEETWRASRDVEFSNCPELVL